ncbi:MAG: hypothetical protein AAFP84_19410 [Actinomycetota bacterium]
MEVISYSPRTSSSDGGSTFTIRNSSTRKTNGADDRTSPANDSRNRCPDGAATTESTLYDTSATTLTSPGSGGIHIHGAEN